MKFSEKELGIIDIAEKLFAEKGFEGTSVRDIAKEACGNVSIVSYYFGSKENLLLAVFERRNEDIKSHINHLLDNTEITDLQKIYIFMDEFLQNTIKHPNLHRLLIREELFNRDPKIFSMIYDFKRANLAMIEKIIEHGKETGEFKKEIPLTFLMATFVGTITQLFVSKDFYMRLGGGKCSAQEGLDPEVTKQLRDYLKNVFKIMLVAE